VRVCVFSQRAMLVAVHAACLHVTRARAECDRIALETACTDRLRARPHTSCSSQCVGCDLANHRMPLCLRARVDECVPLADRQSPECVCSLQPRSPQRQSLSSRIDTVTRHFATRFLGVVARTPFLTVCPCGIRGSSCPLWHLTRTPSTTRGVRVLFAIGVLSIVRSNCLRVCASQGAVPLCADHLRTPIAAMQSRL
jgi:hypothetical protein